MRLHDTGDGCVLDYRGAPPGGDGPPPCCHVPSTWCDELTVGSSSVFEGLSVHQYMEDHLSEYFLILNAIRFRSIRIEILKRD